MSTATSVYGTSRTWRDVRLESVMRSIADIDSVAGNASPLCHQLTIGLSFGLALPLAIECLAGVSSLVVMPTINRPTCSDPSSDDNSQ
jgi:hypothetical protein